MKVLCRCIFMKKERERKKVKLNTLQYKTCRQIVFDAARTK